MSKRHRSTETVLPPREERRARARSERQRINSELADVAEVVSAGLEPDDVEEPGRSWKPVHHRDPDRARAAVEPGAKQRRRRHWKLKEWKRRSAVRRAKAEAERSIAVEGT
jgi:hypothetical protein